MKFATRAIHAGQEPESTTGSVATPIYQTSTYRQQEPGVHRGYTYSRTANPTRTSLEECLASLEQAESAFAFSSGMAAEDAVFRLLEPGDHVLVGKDVYGGTRRLLEMVLSRWGVEHSSVDMTKVGEIVAGLRPKTKMIWVETPSNPLLRVTDISAVSSLAKQHGALCVVDNTFATPFLQRPLALGADIVVHSTTKYLGGHSDVIGGAVCTSNSDAAARLRSLQVAAGAISGPFDAWLVLRGIKTLAVRMQAHCKNADRVARFLTEHRAVARVWYPGLEDHPEHSLAASQMDGFGGMVSLETATAKEARQLASRTKVFLLGESLGGAESLVGYPSMMSHAFAAGGEFAMPETLVRLSVGIEDPDDLVEDLQAALEQ